VVQFMSNQKNEQSQTLRLDGSRVLLVEDEYYIADDLQRILTAAGATVVGPCSTVSIAQEALNRGEFDCAVVDLNLHGESAQPVADRLMAEGRSFAIATGYGSSAVPPHLKGVPRIEKPFDPSALLNLVGQLSCARVV
jgi:DNA-binding NtrC family response regulator